MNHHKGYTLVEALFVIAIIAILISVLGVSVAGMLANARRDTALGQVASVFRAAHTATLATNEERRVVLRITYPNSGGDIPLSSLYEKSPKVDFWVERKLNVFRDWIHEGKPNHSPPLDDVQSLPAGVFLTDFEVDKVFQSVFPKPQSKGQDNQDGTRSWYLSFVYSSGGALTYYQLDGNRQDGELDRGSGDFDPAQGNRVTSNIALHVAYNGTTLKRGGPDEPVPDIDYLQIIQNPSINPLMSSELVQDQQLRSQIHTLYLLRLTGQTVAYDYGIYSPWPKTPLPETAQGPS
jgi:prepilin-type N-terminal cleavage/methylation domain-containing protein